MKKSILLSSILIIFLILPFGGFGQGLDCDSLRLQEIKIKTYPLDKVDSLIALDLKLIQQCIDLDHIDIMILSNSVFTSQLALKGIEKNEITYGVYIDLIIENQKNEMYQEARASLEFMETYGTKKVNKKDKKALKEKFQEMGVTKQESNEIIKYIYKKENKEFSYEKAFVLFWEWKEEINIENNEQTLDLYMLVANHFIDISDFKSIQDTASKSNKVVLFYFTGYADVNSRKMEEAIYKDEKVYELLTKHYLCFVGYADDRSKLTEEEKLAIQDDSMITKGNYVNYLEEKLTSKNYQPLYVIVDANFNVVDTFNYNMELSEFIEFLKKNK